MRGTIAAMALGVMLAGCSKTDVAGTNATTPVANAAATFTPPTSISRADYGGRIERRFQKLDKNKDGKLTADELPGNRGPRMLKRMDTNGDGSIDATEWSTGMLARFDKQDVNKDGNLSSDERGKRGGGKRGGGRRGNRDAPIDDSGDEVDNGF